MQKFRIWETGNKIPKMDRVKVRCKNSASEKLDTKYLKSTVSSQDAKILHLRNWIQNTSNHLHQVKMQKFCSWETGYKIPKSNCIKLRCKNSASGKLDTKCLKSPASSQDAKFWHLGNWIKNT